MAYDLEVFRCLSDNAGVLVHDPATGACAAIDVPDADAVSAALARRGWTLTDILVTHAHADHVQGIAALKAKTGARVVAPAKSGAAVREADLHVGEGDTVTLDVSNDLLRRQVTLIGSWTFSTVGQAECARYVADRGVEVDRLFTHRWTLEQAEEAYRLFDTQTSGKGVILPS